MHLIITSVDAFIFTMYEDSVAMRCVIVSKSYQTKTLHLTNVIKISSFFFCHKTNVIKINI